MLFFGTLRKLYALFANIYRVEFWITFYRIKNKHDPMNKVDEDINKLERTMKRPTVDCLQRQRIRITVESYNDKNHDKITFI